MSTKVDQFEWVNVFERKFYPNFFGTIRGFHGLWDNYITIYEDEKIWVFVTKSEMESKSDELIEHYTTNFNQFKNEIEQTKEQYSEFVQYAWDRRNQGIDNISDDKTVDIINTIEEMHRDIGRSISKLHRPLESRLLEYLNKTRGTSPLDLTNIVLPSEMSFTYRQKVAEYDLINDLLDLKTLESDIKDIIRKGPETGSLPLLSSSKIMETDIGYQIADCLYEDDEARDLIRDYLMRYGSTKRDYGEDIFLWENSLEGPIQGKDKSEIATEVYEDLADRILNDNPDMQKELWKANEKRINQLVKKSRADAGLEKGDNEYYFAKMISKLTEKRYKRRITLTRIDAYLAPLFKRVVDEYAEDLDPTDSRYLELSHLVDLIQEAEPSAAEIVSGMKTGYINYSVGEKEDRLIGSKAKGKIKEIRESLPFPPEKPCEPFTKSGKLRFVGSDKTEITGKAKVIHDTTDIKKKITEGDILVTTMLHPPHFDYLDLPNAIIMSEGTVTCHAMTLMCESITDPIPVITDSQWASELIDDGDRITIDGTSGIKGEIQYEVVP